MIRLSEALTWVDYNAISSDRWEWNEFIVRLHIIIKKDLYIHFSRTKFFGPVLLSCPDDHLCFLPKNHPKINLNDELCSFLLNIESYGNVHKSAYSMKKINDEKSSDSFFSGKKQRR